MMKKEKPSFAEVEQLLSDLAQQDQLSAVQEEAQTELMRGAARGEIRRVFRHRRYLRLARDMAAMLALGGALFLLLPEKGAETQMAAATPVKPQDVRRAVATRKAAGPSYSIAPAAALRSPLMPEEASPSGSAFDCGSESCEVVIYSVPL